MLRASRVLVSGLLVLAACGRGEAFVMSDAAPVAEADAFLPDAGPEDFTSPLVFDDDATLAMDPSTLPAGASPCRPPIAVSVAYATDGDTIEVDAVGGGRTERVRIIGVDTPEVAHGPGEVDQCYGPEARDLTRELVGHVVWLTFDGTCLDPYERTLAYVHVSAAPEGNWSRQLLRRGLARLLLIGGNRSLGARLTADEAAAQREGVGLWSACR